MTEYQQQECKSVNTEGNEETYSESEETTTNSNIRKTKSQEVVAALLASFGYEIEKCSKEFAKQDLKFRDLSVLNRKDLELLGIINEDKQDEMMEIFRMLPNQREHFDNVVESEDAQFCNDLIIHRTAVHIESMETSLASASLKMRIDPSEDIVIEDRNYASSFVLQALDELRKETEEMDDRIALLEETIKRKIEIKSRSKVLQKILLPTVLIASLSIALSFAFLFCKSR